MRIYLASPRTQQQAEHVSGMPVLMSYALFPKWIEKGYSQSFGHILIDSGAFSELHGKFKVELEKYAEFASNWLDRADAIAGLDDISGDWRRSLDNYQKFPVGFPTFHDTDPPELLDELIAMSRERRRWLGIGLLPPRQGKEEFVRDTLERIPDDIHVHGWAMRAYSRFARFDSMDSTNWWRDAMQIRTNRHLAHLNYGECLEIIVKRYQRENRF